MAETSTGAAVFGQVLYWLPMLIVIVMWVRYARKSSGTLSKSAQSMDDTASFQKDVLARLDRIVAALEARSPKP